MHSKIWGKYGWYLLHSTSYLYCPENKDKYMNLLKCYTEILPCPICRKHFSEKLEKIGDAMNNKDSYIKWLIDAHNSVNILFRRNIMNVESVKKLYYKDDKLIIDKTNYIIFGQFILAEAIKRNDNNNNEPFINFFSIVPKILILPEKDFNPDNIKSLSDCYKWGYYFTDSTKERFDELVKKTENFFSKILGRIPTAYEMYEWMTKISLNEEWFEVLKIKITNNPYLYIRNIIINGYNKYLNRDPDKDGFNFYFKKMIKEGMNVEDFYNSLKNSNEAKKISENKIL